METKTKINFGSSIGAEILFAKTFFSQPFQIFRMFSHFLEGYMFWKTCSFTEIYKTNQKIFHIWQQILFL